MLEVLLRGLTFFAFMLICTRMKSKSELEALCIWIGLVSFENTVKWFGLVVSWGNPDVNMSGTFVLSLLSPLVSFIILPGRRKPCCQLSRSKMEESWDHSILTEVVFNMLFYEFICTRVSYSKEILYNPLPIIKLQLSDGVTLEYLPVDWSEGGWSRNMIEFQCTTLAAWFSLSEVSGAVQDVSVYTGLFLSFCHCQLTILFSPLVTSFGIFLLFFDWQNMPLFSFPLPFSTP